MAAWLQRRKTTFTERVSYCTNDRAPFFKLAVEFLPAGSMETIIDIGCGNGEFAHSLRLKDKYPNLYLLDSNAATVEELKKEFPNAIRYKIPKILPFENESVSMIHCSHVIEHLYYEQFYDFLVEIDRVLKKHGIIIISSPLSWKNFYHDLSHVKPYYPESILRYLAIESENFTNSKISNQYSVEKLIYRYHRQDYMEEGIGSDYFLLDCAIHFFKHLLRRIAINNYVKSGFTLILKKN
jgi:SAM-dependent methyltransferase